MEADVTPDTKTRKRTEDAVGGRAINADSSSARKVDSGSMSSTWFGMTAEPPALLLRDDALVDKGAATPKLRLSPVEMRTLTATGGLLSAGQPLQR